MPMGLVTTGLGTQGHGWGEHWGLELGLTLGLTEGQN